MAKQSWFFKREELVKMFQGEVVSSEDKRTSFQLDDLSPGQISSMSLSNPIETRIHIHGRELTASEFERFVNIFQLVKRPYKPRRKYRRGG